MKAWNHFQTITKHKLMVMNYCFRVGLYRQGLLHDLSKYSPSEFLVGCRYYQGDRSPNNAEREATGVSRAWLHHKGRNKHHFEYWVDYALNDEHIINGAKMPRKYVAEMVMDRISASRTYMGDAYTDQAPLMYFLKGKEKLWFIHPETSRDLEALLRILSDHGEEKMLRYVRNVYLKK
ncbi:MAG: catalase [Blautia sp.]|nr:catalase [Blautia sp.]